MTEQFIHPGPGMKKKTLMKRRQTFRFQHPFEASLSRMLSRRLLWLALVVANLSTCRGQDDADDADNVVEVEVDSVVDSDEENDAKGGTIHDLFSNEESG